MDSYFKNLSNKNSTNFNHLILNNFERFEDDITDEEFQQINMAIRENSIWVSLSETTNQTFGNSSYPSTYGEITRIGMKEMFKGIETKGKTFIDLGSGLGKTVLYAVIDNNFKYAVGIELAKERHQQAKLMHQRLPLKIQKRVNYFNNDLFNFNLKEFDIIFVSNLCFSESMNKKIAEKIALEGKDKIYIFSSKEFFHPNIKLLEKRPVKMTWKNDSNVYLHQLDHSF